jgi:hypothetical protein
MKTATVLAVMMQLMWLAATGGALTADTAKDLGAQQDQQLAQEGTSLLLLVQAEAGDSSSSSNNNLGG